MANIRVGMHEGKRRQRGKARGGGAFEYLERAQVPSYAYLSWSVLLYDLSV